MENVMNVAGYVYRRYEKEFGGPIDEMKLHKLLYFAQRESLIQTDSPLFEATFYGWKYGPVLKEIRGAYRDEIFAEMKVQPLEKQSGPVMDKVFREYAPRDSWSLSRLSHGELSWRNSRVGVPDAANGDRPMQTEDIRKDAERIRTRRARLEVLRQLELI